MNGQGRASGSDSYGSVILGKEPDGRKPGAKKAAQRRSENNTFRPFPGR